MIIAHVGGVPVEETLQPLMIALMVSGAWFAARLRRPRGRHAGRSAGHDTGPTGGAGRQ